MERFDKMRYNLDLLHEIWKVRNGDPTYSFFFKRELPDDNNDGKGYIRPHYLEGKKITHKDGKEYWIGSVQVHFYCGYYYHIIAHDINKSSVVIWVPINSEMCGDKYKKYTLEDNTKLIDHLKTD